MPGDSPDPIGFVEGTKYVAWASIAAVVGIVYGLRSDALRAAWLPAGITSVSLAYLARVAFLIALITLVFRWVNATHWELIVWSVWLNHTMPRQQVYGAMFGLGSAMGLCIAFADRAEIAAPLMFLFFAFGIWTQAEANRYFREALGATRKGRISNKKAGALKALENYWEGRPHVGRCSLIAAVSLPAAVLGVAAVFAGERSGMLKAIAYAALISVIAISEVVIFTWRRVRDREVDAAAPGWRFRLGKR